MSKIDELIEDITKEFKRCNTDYNGSATLDSDQINIIKQIEQLRPYVELAEMIIDEDITKDIEFNNREDYLRFAKLYQQIKEQRNETI